MAHRPFPNARRRGGLPLPVLALGVLLVGLVGGALVLHATGAIRIPLLTPDEPARPAVDRSGLVRVPRTARPVEAYAAVSRDDLWDPREQELSAVYLRRSEVAPEMITDVGAILGRVLRRTKPAGYVFTEADFYPKGTRAGPTAGVPSGKRALRLRATDVPGLHGLNQGDRFDLVMTVAVELEEPPRSGAHADDGLDVEGPYAGMRLSEGRRASENEVRVKRKHAEVRTIVRNGIVVEPVHQRKEISKAASLLRGATLQTTPVEELIIAVEPEEVAELNLALAVEAKLQVAMRSGQVDEGQEQGEIPDIQVAVDDGSSNEGGATEPAGTVRVVEVIEGREKHLHAVPANPDDAS